MPNKLIKGIDHIGVCIVFLCHDGQGNLVMNRRSINARDEHGTWDIGGGGLRFGETAEQCLAREIKEEYCADIEKYDFLGYRDVHREHEGKSTHWIALDFIVQIDRSQVAIGDPEKMDEIAWFSLENLPPDNERHSQAPDFWQRYLQKLSSALENIKVKA